MKDKSPVKDTANGRRKLLAGIGIFSLLSVWMGGLFPGKRSAIACAPPAKKETIKVLSQDGQLMEVDISSIRAPGKKVSDQELRDWIKRK